MDDIPTLYSFCLEKVARCAKEKYYDTPFLNLPQEVLDDLSAYFVYTEAFSDETLPLLCLPHLKMLCLRNTKLEADSFKTIFYLTNLEHLDLKKTNIPPDILHTVAQNLIHLKTLNLSDLPVADETLHQFLENSGHSLESLYLSHNDLTTLEPFRNTKPNHLCNLRYLEMVLCKEVTDDLWEVLEELKCPLEKLRVGLSSAGFDFDKFAMVPSRLRLLTNLEVSLHLRDAHLTVVGQLEHLQVIRIYDMSPVVKPSQEEPPVNVLGVFAKVNCPYVSDEVMDYLQHQSPQLKAIMLMDCPKITDVGVKSLANLGHLVYLHLSNCKKITDKALIMVSERWRHVRIINWSTW